MISTLMAKKFRKLIPLCTWAARQMLKETLAKQLHTIAGNLDQQLRPALVNASIRMRKKLRLVEAFIKPTLLYGLGTAVIRKVALTNKMQF